MESNSQNTGALIDRLVNTPLLMEPNSALRLINAYNNGLGSARLSAPVPAAGETDVTAASYFSRDANHSPYRVVDGIAIIPISGSLYHKWGWISSYSAGYDEILRWVNLALKDNSVKGILFDFDSPGGEVAGCFDLADKLFELRGAKPFWSSINDMCASAAYALTSATDRRLITQTGEAGSIGVVMAHYSYEKQILDAGVEVTLIHAGSHKVDGNRYENLPKDVLKEFQRETDVLRAEFAGIVSRNIGLSVEKILATEAAVFRGQEAIDIGFADELVNGNDVIQLFSESLSSQGRTFILGATMSENENKAEAAAPAANKQKEATVEAPVVAAAAEQPPAKASPDAALAERERVKGIIGHEKAAGKSNLAKHLAFETDMSVDAAADMLGVAAEEVSGESGPNALDLAMEGAAKVTIAPGTTSKSAQGSDKSADAVDRIMKNFDLAKGT